MADWFKGAPSVKALLVTEVIDRIAKFFSSAAKEAYEVSEDKKNNAEFEKELAKPDADKKKRTDLEEDILSGT